MSIDRNLYFGIVAAAVLATAGGCSGDKSDGDKSGGSSAAGTSGQSGGAKINCDAVGEHLASLTRHKFQGLQGRKKKIMKTQLQLVREEFSATCKQEKWSSDIRSCMTAAADLSAFNSCTAPLRKARGLPPPALKSGDNKGPGAAPKVPAPTGPAPAGDKKAPTPPPGQTGATSGQTP